MPNIEWTNETKGKGSFYIAQYPVRWTSSSSNTGTLLLEDYSQASMAKIINKIRTK